MHAILSSLFIVGAMLTPERLGWLFATIVAPLVTQALRQYAWGERFKVPICFLVASVLGGACWALFGGADPATFVDWIQAVGIEGGAAGTVGYGLLKGATRKALGE